MTDSLLVRLGIGSRLRVDGDVVEIVGLNDTHAVLRDGTGRVSSLSVAELLTDRRRTQLLDARVVPEREPAAIGLSLASAGSLEHANSRAAHVREVLTGYRSGHEDLALPGEPRPEYAPGVAMMRHYAHKAAEAGVSESAVRKWVRQYQHGGEAALLQQQRHGPLPAVDTRWLDTARALLDELTDAPR
ncbi:helix-turn-helix domain containing protein [Dactylosporangium sp. NBC_01737]|uniref:helix-turn-helix domain-containing protein n=1 Tax=Dactylosporangium sp. NBC_01737 TaxID=2975959 RepID=UPI002E10D9E3|nr:helix-turn-helix domain containing protein [Dactylosporangium sp. NBC_01737]